MQFQQSALQLLLTIIACVLQQQQQFIRATKSNSAVLPTHCLSDKCIFVIRSGIGLISCFNRRLTEFPVCSTQLHHSNININIDLRENDLTQLPARGLYNLVRLAPILLLDLTNNQINDVHVDAFKDLQGVIDIKLNNNKLTTIDAATLEPLRSSIQFLSLHSNNINEIKAFTFAYLAKLTSLDLRSNQIESFHSTAFFNCSQLETIYLADNKLKKIPARLFSSLVSLANIFLSDQRSPLLIIEDFEFERDAPSNDQFNYVRIDFLLAQQLQQERQT